MSTSASTETKKTTLYTVGITVSQRASVPAAPVCVGLISERLSRGGFDITGFTTESGPVKVKEHRPLIQLTVRASQKVPPCLSTISDIAAAALRCDNTSLHVSQI